MNLINKILIVIIAIVVFYAIFLIYSDLNLVKDRLGEFKIEFLPHILTLVILGWFVAFYKWVLLLKQSNIEIPLLQNFHIFMSGYALSIVPGKVGELIKSQILKTKFNVPRTKTASIIVVEQIYNLIGLVTVSCLGLGLIIIFQIEFFEVTSFVIMGATIVLTFILILIKSRTAFEKVFHKFSKFKFISKYELSYEESYEVIKKSLNGKFSIFLSLLSAAYWIIESVVVYFVLLAFDVDILEFTTIIATYTSSIILGVASFLPMGIGVTEGSLTGFFALKGVDISLALTIVIFIRIFTRWIGVGLGFISLKIIGGFSIESKKEN